MVFLVAMYWNVTRGIAGVSVIRSHDQYHMIHPNRVKYTGLLGMALIGLLTIADLWQLLGTKFLPLV